MKKYNKKICFGLKLILMVISFIAVSNIVLAEETFVATTDYNVTINWLDDQNSKNTRPGNLDIILYSNGQQTGEVPTLLSTGDDTWTYAFENLPIFAEDGTIVKYSAKESDVLGYTVTTSATSDEDYNLSDEAQMGGQTSCNTTTFDIVVTSSLTDLDFIVAKRGSYFLIWTSRNITDDEKSIIIENAENAYPSFKENNIEYVAGYGSHTLDSDNTISVTRATGDSNDTLTLVFSNKSDWSTWVDGVLQGTYTSGSTKFTNKLNYITTSVSKEWVDEDDADGLRDEVTIFLKANDEVIETVKLNDNNYWSYDFENLAEYYFNGNELVPVQYSVEEDEFEGYTSEVTGNINDGFVVTNTHKVIPVNNEEEIEDLGVGGADIEDEVKTEEPGVGSAEVEEVVAPVTGIDSLANNNKTYEIIFVVLETLLALYVTKKLIKE